MIEPAHKYCLHTCLKTSHTHTATQKHILIAMISLDTLSVNKTEENLVFQKQNKKIAITELYMEVLGCTVKVLL